VCHDQSTSAILASWESSGILLSDLLFAEYICPILPDSSPRFARVHQIALVKAVRQDVKGTGLQALFETIGRPHIAHRHHPAAS
jgi:hypothetical protein